MTKKSKKGSMKPVIILLILAIFAVGVWLGIEKFKNTQEVGSTQNGLIEETKKEELKPKTFAGNERPLAFMIDNNINAMPQAGLEQADLVYEIIVEGGETRLMAIIKNKEISKIGPLRSARHYYLDYALENDAIYVHHGYSPQAREDWNSLGVDRIEVNESTTGWRDKSASKTYEFTLFSSIEKLNKGLGSKRTERNNDLLLNYSADEVDLSQLEGAIPANKLNIKYSGNTNNNYVYDKDNKFYLRSVNNKSQDDYVTGKQLTVKNIIVYSIKYSGISGDDKGRQTIDNIGEGNGYYISNVYAIPITWSKKSRKSQTIYRYNNGQEITVNDGNTFIQIVPESGSINITE